VSDLFDPQGRSQGLLFHRRTRESVDPLKNRDRFVRLLRGRIASRHQNIVIIDASDTGEGKSTLGIQLARGVAPTWSVRDTAYSAEEARALYFEYEQEYRKAWDAGTKLPVKSLLWDEAVLGLLSQGGRRNEELERTVQILSTIRVIGVSVFLAIPRIRMLDAFVREGLAEYWIMVMRRGEGRPHEHFVGAMYRRPDRLPYDEMSSFDPIGFENMDGMTMTEAELRARPGDAELFRAYESRKLRAIHDFLNEKPGGESKVASCAVCGLRSTKFNVETHKCRGPPKGGSARTA
jgi:hypothetical protein